MFNAHFPDAVIRFPHGNIITLSKHLPAAVPKFARTVEAKRLGYLLRGEAANPQDLALPIFKDIRRAAVDSETVIAQTDQHIDKLKRVHAALAEGAYDPTDADPMVRSAVEMFGLRQLLHDKQPDSALTSEAYGEALAALMDAITALEEAVETARSRLSALAALEEKAAKACFVHHEDVGQLLRMGVHKSLPHTWRRHIDEDAPLGKATFEPFEADPANISASILQARFEDMLKSERKRASDTRRAAKKQVESSQITQELREVHK